MSGPAASTYGSEEPQCYNCGAQGHWAVACPEPTRQTPAGLAAWRNASHARPGSGNGGNRERRGSSKKHKGPIITKYGPPPGQHLQPPPPPPPHVSSYPQSGTAYLAHAPYPPPAGPPPPPGPPHYSQYPPPPAHLYPAQASPDYPPRHHVEPHYPPTPPAPSQGSTRPPPYGFDAQPTYGFPHQSTLPPPPSHYGPSPPGYHAYPERGHDTQRYGPPSLAHPTYGSPPPSYGRPRGHSHGHSSEPTTRPPPHRFDNSGERHRAPPPQTPPSRKATGSQNRNSSTSSAPLQLPTPLIHSLPPKPPQSRHTQPEPPRGKQSKKDRKNRQRANKQRDGHKIKERERKGQTTSPSYERPDRTLSRKSDASVEPQERENSRPRTPQSDAQVPSDVLPEEDAPTLAESAEAAQLQETEETPKLLDSIDGELPEEDDLEWNLAELFKESEAQHAPDEVGRPLPFSYHEDVLLPRKWDAPCVVSEFVTPNNLEQYIRPVHETEYWPCIEFDPAFIVDGKLPCGEPIPQHLRSGEMPPSKEKERAESSRQEDEDHSALRPLNDNNAEDDKEKRGEKRHRPSDVRKRDSYIPPYRERSRSRDKRSRSRDSQPRSRRSSVSSLNSLEAALLGISEDPNSPGSGPSQPSYRQDDRSRSPKRKRKRPRTESAYSRRW